MISSSMMATAAVIAFGQNIVQANELYDFDNCHHFLTVQTKACQVEMYHDCKRDTGDVLLRERFDAKGASSIEIQDALGAHLSMITLSGKELQVFEADISAQSIPDRDAFDRGEKISFVADMYGDKGIGLFETITQRLTDRKVVVDGRKLQVVRATSDIRLTSLSGEHSISANAEEYYFSKYDVVLEGRGLIREGGKTRVSDFSPIKIYERGHAQFQDTTPSFGCDEAGVQK